LAGHICNTVVSTNLGTAYWTRPSLLELHIVQKITKSGISLVDHQDNMINQTVGTFLTETESRAPVYRLNDQEALHLLPAILVFGVLMLTGTVGNVLVLYIYTCKCPRSNHKYCIVVLGSLDLLACSIGMPFEIADMRFPYTFYEHIPCRVFRCITTVSTVGSGLILVLISVDSREP
jgi:hypothetical protein